MPRRIAVAILVLSCAAGAAQAREGFGFTKKAAEMNVIHPPAITISGTRVAVNVRDRGGLFTEASELRRQIEQIVTSTGRLRLATPADATVEVELLHLDIDVHTNSKVVYEQEKQKDSEGKTVYRRVPKTKYYTAVNGSMAGSYKVNDARGRTLDDGDVDDRFEDESEYSSWTREKVRDRFLGAAALKIAGRIAPWKDRVSVLLPKGSFEASIPIAEANAWDRYLEAVQGVRPLGDRASEAYRQYAIGVADEGLAYATSDLARSRQLLREAAEHYRTAINDNPEEKLFSEAHTGFFGGTSAPLARVEASLAAFEAWRPGSAAPGPAVASRNTTTRKSAKTLRNQSVIDMRKAGLSDDNIILAIKGAAAVDFDTSPDGLIALSKAGVSNRVIKAMQTKQE